MSTEKEKDVRPSPQAPTSPKYLWHNGKLLPWETATVHITSIGWTAISAVFEGIRAYWNEVEQELHIFRLEEHLRRLANSMKLMRMIPPFSHQELKQAIIELLQGNELKEDSYIQPLVYFSGAVPGYRAVEGQPAEILITTRPAPSNLNSGRESHCCISTWVRIGDNSMPPRAKCLTNYQNSRLVSTEARINGYDSGIILNTQGKVAEGAYACIFIVRDGMAITPGVTAGILESITRATVIQFCHEVLHVPVQERDVDRTELYIADEAFLCGTLAEIEPVVSVDRYPVGSGEEGPITKATERLYHDVTRGLDSRYTSWRAPVWQG